MNSTTNESSHYTNTNLYDLWKARLPSDDFANEPMVNMLSSGSDYTGFYSMFGIPGVDIRYEYDKVKVFLR